MLKEGSLQSNFPRMEAGDEKGKDGGERGKEITRREALKKIFKVAGEVAVAGVGAKGLLKIAENFSSEPEEKKSEKFSENGALAPEKAGKKEILSPKDVSREKIISWKEKYGQELLDAYLELSKKEEFFPAKVFEKDFLIALQIQESKYKNKAISSAEAFGVMQILESAIKDVSYFLYYLDKKGELSWRGKTHIDHLRFGDASSKNAFKKRLGGEKVLSKEQLAEFVHYLKNEKHSADQIRAVGKIYLMRLLAPKERGGYEVGREWFKEGKFKETQAALLKCYNGGLAWKNISLKKCPRETQDYVERIFAYKERLKEVRTELARYAILPAIDGRGNVDQLAVKLVIEMDNFSDNTEKGKFFLADFLKAAREKQNQMRRALSMEETEKIMKEKIS